MSDIVKLAEASAKAAKYLRELGMQNVYGQTPEERVASSAQYRLAYDAWVQAEMDYRNAINGLSAEKLSALASGSK